MSETFDMGPWARGLGLSPEASEFFARMTEPEWNAWKPRYLALLDLANGRPAILSDLQWWETNVLDVMTAHCGMTALATRSRKLQ